MKYVINSITLIDSDEIYTSYDINFVFDFIMKIRTKNYAPHHHIASRNIYVSLTSHVTTTVPLN